MAATIGICIATIEGGVVCHQEIGREASRRGVAYPEIITHTPRYDRIRKAVENDDLGELPDALTESINLLADAGAEFGIIPSNTMHLVFDEVSARSRIRLLHIVAVAAEFCRAQGYRTVGVLGTGSTMRRRLFDAPLRGAGVEAVYPEDADMNRLTQVIATELIAGILRPDSVHDLTRIAARLGARADALILGCTELPIVLTPENCELPLIDTTRLLARAALDVALASSRG